jgi:multicomponent Na+:H+ antiporter subunit E
MPGPEVPRPDQAASRGDDIPVKATARRKAQWRGFAVTALILAGLWAALHSHDPLSWVIGAPMALLGGAVAFVLPGAAAPHLSPIGFFRFGVFALNGVFWGAWDVALRALDPTKSNPGHLVYRTRLPDGRPRRLFAIAITMLPGTLTARLDGARLQVHALDVTDAVVEELRQLEARIAGLYGLTLTGDDT